MQMSYRYPYNDSVFHQAAMSPTTPGGSSNPSTPVNNPWDFDVATSAPNPAQQPQDTAPSTSLSTLHPAEFSPEELFSTSTTTAAVSSPTVIRLEERVPVVPSQYHRSRIRAASGESRPRTHLQGDASSANAEQPAGTSTGTASSSGPVRTSVTDVERTRPHPYRRPHSAGETGTVSRAGGGVAKTSRSVSDQARRSPLTGENSSGLARMSSPSAAPGTALGRPTSPSKVYSIRTDIHFNVNTNTMIAMLELPGVKHDELSVTLATEPYTHARQISVSGRTHPPFVEPAPEERERTKLERKFGDFLRRLHVPPHTQAADINAEMKDGVLVLTVHLGAPAAVEAPQNITIN